MTRLLVQRVQIWQMVIPSFRKQQVSCWMDFFARLKLHNENYKSHNDEKLMKFYDEKFWDIK